MRNARLLFACAMLAVLMLVPAIATAAPAPPFETNGECLECHDLATGAGALSKVDFEVPGAPAPTDAPTVDMAKCNNCHWVAAHYNHGADTQCNSCHYAMPSRSDFYYPFVSTPYGNFTSANSPALDAFALHRIHANGSWPRTVTADPYTSQPTNCVSCHSPAACDACHVDVPHGAHPASAYPAVTARVARGVAAGSAVLDTTSTEAVTCINAECHSLADAENDASKTVFEETSPFIGYVGSWFAGTVPTGGTYTYARLADSTATFTFEGPGYAELISRRSTRGGIAEISVDGGAPTTVDLYSPAGFWNYMAFRTPNVGEGLHTVTIRVTGLRTLGSTSTEVVVDSFRVFRPAANEFVPGCGDACHIGDARDPVDRRLTHGYEQIDHEGDAGGQSFGGKECRSCHSMDVLTEHERSSSASAGGVCDTCHPTPRDSFGAWDQTCQQGGCHAASSPQEPHAAIAAGHTPPAAGAMCADCHPGDLGAVHTEATSAGDPTLTSCNVCHTTSAYPATNDCTICHFTFDGHYDAVKHTSTWTLEGCDGTGCHGTRDLMGAHTEKNAEFTCFGCHASADPTVQAAIENNLTGCGDCHTDITSGGGHYSVHAAIPPLVNADGTGNYAYLHGSAGGVKTTDCGMCHRGNLVDEHLGSDSSVPKRTFSGAFLTCGSCHESTNPDVIAAIGGTGLTACENCHQVHAQIPVTHASAYTADPSPGCSTCHSSDLTVVHNGDMTTTTPSGQVLTGCALCHNYYEGDMGTRVQTAIDLTNDTRCTACHADYHGEAAGKHAATAPESQECAGCHTDGSEDGSVTVPVLHEGIGDGCSVCHANASRVGTLTTAECANCHNATYPIHGGIPAKHTFGGMDASCRTVGCHVANTLPEEHQRFLGRYPEYADTCALCHANADSERIDWGSATADCSTCHTVHGNIPEIHTAPDSQECVDCHESADLRSVHATDQSDPSTSCARCHNATFSIAGKTAKCVDCHDYSPADPKHYAIEDHSASVSGGCEGCHSVDMKTEHFKSSSGPVTCVQCHELKVDAFATDWDRSCAACHPTKHGEQNSKHVSTTTACSGSGCHVITDVSAIHAGAAQTPVGFTDGFESGTGGWATFSGWTRITSPRHSGSYAAGQSSTSVCTLLRNVATNAGADVQFSFWLYGNANTESTDWVKVEFKSTTGTWRTVWTKTLQDRAASWQQVSLTLPEATYGPFGPNTAVRITADVSDSSEYQRIDDVSLSQVVTESSTVGCNYCHKSASEPATTTNCTTTGCHSAPNPHHGSITLKLTSSSTWAAACDDCHGRVHDRGSCDRCHNPTGLHGEASSHIDSNTACVGCHNVATADGSLNCLACHTDLGSGSDGGDDGGWGGGGGW